MNFQEYLSNKCKEIIDAWDEAENIYAISFYVDYNESCTFGEVENFPNFSIGYNTENDCKSAPKYSEERWNFAFWSQNNTPIIDCESKESCELLLQWYKDNGIQNVGDIIEGDQFDENMNYIGKGPVGYYELLLLISDIAKQFQSDGTIKEKFGNVPIIIHDLEYPWYVKEMTKKANPNGEAEDFLQAYNSIFETVI